MLDKLDAGDHNAYTIFEEKDYLVFRAIDNHEDGSQSEVIDGFSIRYLERGAR